jgi:hypothetical protein
MTAADRPVVLPPQRRVDVGLGSAYERWAVYELLKRWLEPCEVRTALEGPVDGMAGIPGLHLIPSARNGARVTVLVPDAEAAEVVRGVYRTVGIEENLDVRVSTEWPDETFDLVLSYSALPFVADWRGYLAAAAAHARRHLIVSVTHPTSWGVYVGKALRLARLAPRKLELFDHPATRSRVLEPELLRYGRIVRDSFVDCPWWPDIPVDSGETLASGILRRLPFGWGRRHMPATPAVPEGSGAPFLYGPGRFPFFGGEGWNEEFAAALRRHPNLDGCRFRSLSGVLAHQRIRAIAIR